MSPRRMIAKARIRPTMKMGKVLPLSFMRNPLKGGTKYVRAGVTTMKKGAGIYVKMVF